MEINGCYFDGENARQLSAQLKVSDDAVSSLIINVAYQDGHCEQFILAFDDFDITSRLGDTARELSFGQRQLFVTMDNDAVDQLIERFDRSGLAALLHKLESKIVPVMLASMVVLVVVWASFVYGIPSAAKFIAYRTPDFVTDKSIMRRLNSLGGKPQSSNDAAELTQDLDATISQFLSTHLPTPECIQLADQFKSSYHVCYDAME